MFNFYCNTKNTTNKNKTNTTYNNNTTERYVTSTTYYSILPWSTILALPFTFFFVFFVVVVVVVLVFFGYTLVYPANYNPGRVST